MGSRPHIQQEVCCNDSAHSCAHIRKELHPSLSGEVFSRNANSTSLTRRLFFLKRNLKSSGRFTEVCRWFFTSSDSLWLPGLESGVVYSKVLSYCVDGGRS